MKWNQHTPCGVVAAVLCGGWAALSGCAAPAAPRFPLAEVVWQDADRRPVAEPPAEYVSSFAWDAADNMVFRPVAKFLQVDPGGEARNVNALDEVADSSWFENRLGRQRLSPEDVGRGPCLEDLDPSGEDGSWLIDQGKANGATPGFRVRTQDGDKYLLKTDVDGAAERASAASAIGVRMYHAAGFFTACDSVVYFHPKLLTLKPGLTITDNTGVAKPFDESALRQLLSKAMRRGELVRMQSSKWLPGPSLGPFRYEGTRKDDPNDVVPHEDRRELRGARLLAAWLNHFDTREQNSMTTWVSLDPNDPKGTPGYVKHYYLDISDALGSEWSNDGISRRLGKSYYFDAGQIAFDFFTFGLTKRPYDDSDRDPATPGFGYFRAEDFDPEGWKAGYQNPAFLRMTERDGAWMARIIARFSREDVDAIVRSGQLEDPRVARALVDTLMGRRLKILQRYLARLSPLADVRARPGGFCALDLARREGVAAAESFRYRASLEGEGRALPVAVGEDGEVCVELASTARDEATERAGDDPSRYRVVRVHNGQARGPLLAHFYDLGPARGLVLVGLTRPTR